MTIEKLCILWTNVHDGTKLIYKEIRSVTNASHSRKYQILIDINLKYPIIRFLIFYIYILSFKEIF